VFLLAADMPRRLTAVCASGVRFSQNMIGTVLREGQLRDTFAYEHGSAVKSRSYRSSQRFRFANSDQVHRKVEKKIKELREAESSKGRSVVSVDEPAALAARGRGPAMASSAHEHGAHSRPQAKVQLVKTLARHTPGRPVGTTGSKRVKTPQPDTVAVSEPGSQRKRSRSPRRGGEVSSKGGGSARGDVRSSVGGLTTVSVGVGANNDMLTQMMKGQFDRTALQGALGAAPRSCNQ
jgi:hypothetical protein